MKHTRLFSALTGIVLAASALNPASAQSTVPTFAPYDKAYTLERAVEKSTKKPVGGVLKLTPDNYIDGISIPKSVIPQYSDSIKGTIIDDTVRVATENLLFEITDLDEKDYKEGAPARQFIKPGEQFPIHYIDGKNKVTLSVALKDGGRISVHDLERMELNTLGDSFQYNTTAVRKEGTLVTPEEVLGEEVKAAEELLKRPVAAGEKPGALPSPTPTQPAAPPATAKPGVAQSPADTAPPEGQPPLALIDEPATKPGAQTTTTPGEKPATPQLHDTYNILVYDQLGKQPVKSTTVTPKVRSQAELIENGLYRISLDGGSKEAIDYENLEVKLADSAKPADLKEYGISSKEPFRFNFFPHAADKTYILRIPLTNEHGEKETDELLVNIKPIPSAQPEIKPWGVGFHGRARSGVLVNRLSYVNGSGLGEEVHETARVAAGLDLGLTYGPFTLSVHPVVEGLNGNITDGATGNRRGSQNAARLGGLGARLAWHPTDGVKSWIGDSSISGSIDGAVIPGSMLLNIGTPEELPFGKNLTATTYTLNVALPRLIYTNETFRLGATGGATFEHLSAQQTLDRSITELGSGVNTDLYGGLISTYHGWESGIGAGLHSQSNFQFPGATVDKPADPSNGPLFNAYVRTPSLFGFRLGAQGSYSYISGLGINPNAISTALHQNDFRGAITLDWELNVGNTHTTEPRPSLFRSFNNFE